jgi:hypothetical protein
LNGVSSFVSLFHSWKARTLSGELITMISGKKITDRSANLLTQIGKISGVPLCQPFHVIANSGGALPAAGYYAPALKGRNLISLALSARWWSQSSSIFA